MHTIMQMKERGVIMRNLSIKTDYLKMIGELLKVRRHELGVKQNVVAGDERAIRGYRNIEQGICVSTLNKYQIWCNRLNCQFNYVPEVNRILQTIFNQIYNAIEFCSTDKISSLLAEGEVLLQKYPNDLFYRICLKIFSLIEQCKEQDKVMTQDDFLLLERLVQIDMGLITPIVKELIFYYMQLNYTELDQCIKLYEKYQINDHDFSTLKLNHIYMLKLQNKTEEAIECAKRSTAVALKSRNYVRLMDSYFALAYLYSQHDEQKVEFYLQKGIEQFSKISQSLSLQKKGQIHYNIAMTYYRMHKYEEALYYFDNSLQYLQDTRKKIAQNFAIIAGVMINKDITKYIDESSIQRNIYEDRFLYFYIKNHRECTAKELEDFIIEKILPNLNIGDEASISVYFQEMCCLAKKTRNYKNLLLFETILSGPQSKSA